MRETVIHRGMHVSLRHMFVHQITLLSLPLNRSLLGNVAACYGRNSLVSPTRVAPLTTTSGESQCILCSYTCIQYPTPLMTPTPTWSHIRNSPVFHRPCSALHTANGSHPFGRTLARLFPRSPERWRLRGGPSHEDLWGRWVVASLRIASS